MTKKRVSIKDIAGLAGVSHPTVSRALRGEGRMSDETRARILAIAQEVGYTPSMIGRGLVTQRSLTVGIVVTNLADPFHSAITQGAEDAAHEHGYSILLATAGVDPDREYEVVRNFQSRQVDGIIVSSSRVGNRYADLLAETGIPIVLVNAHADGDNMHAIYHDDFDGMCQLVQHLIDQGHRRIAHISNIRGGKAQIDRQRAWVEMMTTAGLDPELFAYGATGRIEGGVEAAQTLIGEANRLWNGPPDAICCYNDTMAAGAMAHLRTRGIHVPDEVAITGFDDVEFAAYLEPPLTTWRQPRREMGTAAMRLMLDLLDRPAANGSPSPPQVQTVMSGQLMLRRSSLRAERVGR